MSFWLLFSISSSSSVWNVVESIDERSVEDDVITVVAAKRKFFNFGGESIVSKSIADWSNIYFKSFDSLVDDDWFIKSRNNERTLFKWSL